jgi:hypothetical protein
MKHYLKSYKLEITGVIVGAVAGWCYWYFVGCASGNCAITSNPYNSTIYGAIMGALGFGMFSNSKKKNTNEKR